MTMNKFRKSLLIGATILSLGSSAFIANAQTAPAEQSPGDRATGGHHRHGGAKSPEQMKEKMAKRQAELRDKLNLNASQQSAWNLFTAAIMPSGDWKRPDRAEWQNLSAPERLEKQLAMLKEREARMTSVLAATKTFYATLTPEQQKIFNDNFMARGHRHGKG
jgi:protein CpxP